MIDAKSVIQLLSLEPLSPEGGYFKRSYTSTQIVPFHGDRRPVSTAIYYLVTPESFSTLHRLRSEEVFHFYLGDPVEMVKIDARGVLTRLQLGTDLVRGQRPQLVVGAGVWQGTKLLPGGTAGFALLGCTVAPGFDWSDIEQGERLELARLFPHHKAVIEEFTKKS